ncbi:MAG TPA: bifunctional 4-hydroxy-2-oxoglutarate aldolase/2-dehydro-3-deoxy-phosphogluconate aldolase, partial [Longimicrobiaceae bacterium]|nr:bifunctional 4-hydroxy-2-oxoglutarate aldolase/2-dehydro-3-deoxy-phosphogluconate aldolase [Longimicrobiaceae bacterium]
LGAVAVVRTADASRLLRVVDALHAGGVSAVEVTMTTSGALDAIAELARRVGDAVLVGVGSVLDADTARRAAEAGARYVVSPVLRPEVVREAHRQGVPAMPGAFTPTEILQAHEAGADVVKVFPAEVLGPSFIRGVLAPMPFLRLMPTGGVTPDNVGEWIAAGAVAVGLGSALVDPRRVGEADLGWLTERARRLADGVARARGTAGGAR